MYETVYSADEAATRAQHIGYPVQARPRVPFGNCGAKQCNDEAELRAFIKDKVIITPSNPLTLEAA